MKLPDKLRDWPRDPRYAMEYLKRSGLTKAEAEDLVRRALADVQGRKDGEG